MAESKDAPGWWTRQRSDLHGRMALRSTTGFVGAIVLWLGLAMLEDEIRSSYWPHRGPVPPLVNAAYLLAHYGSATAFIAIFVIGPFHLLWAMLMRRRAARFGYRLCGNCGYDLNQTAEPGPCPECGQEFRMAELERYWKHGG